MQNQDQLPQNAEFLDYEDDEEDIKRKATIRTVKSKIVLQKWFMTPLYISGCFKLLRRADFVMQMYFGYLIELITFTVPITSIQIINNVMLEKWTIKSITAVIIMGLSLIVHISGLVDVAQAYSEN